MTLRILVADDHDVVRRGLKCILQPHPGWEICGEAPNGREAVAQAEKLKPDVVVMDISMPQMNGLEAAMGKLELHSVSELVLYAVRNQIIEA
jgi:DNA-binding NarL/FixJ family response regulator